MGKNYRKFRDTLISAKGYRNHTDEEADFCKRHNKNYISVTALQKAQASLTSTVVWNSAYTKKLIKNRFRPMHELEKILRGHYTPEQIKARLKEIENDKKYAKYFDSKKKYEDKKGEIEMENEFKHGRKLTNEDYELLWNSKELKEKQAIVNCESLLSKVSPETVRAYCSFIRRECRGTKTTMSASMREKINELHIKDFGVPLPTLNMPVNKPEEKSDILIGNKKMTEDDYKRVWEVRHLSKEKAAEIYPYLFDDSTFSSKTTRNYMTIMKNKQYDKMSATMRKVAEMLDAGETSTPEVSNIIEEITNAPEFDDIPEIPECITITEEDIKAKDVTIKYGLMLGDDLKVTYNSEVELKAAELAYSSLGLAGVITKVRITLEII